jgi:large subunit ribosomal protein L21
MAFAVIKTGGKQYKVEVGDVLSIEKLDTEETTVTFNEVLLLDDESSSKIGTPFIAGASVTAEILEQFRAPKLDVVKYHSKSRYYKKNGHRQPMTKVKITSIK